MNGRNCRPRRRRPDLNGTHHHRPFTSVELNDGAPHFSCSATPQDTQSTDSTFHAVARSHDVAYHHLQTALPTSTCLFCCSTRRLASYARRHTRALRICVSPCPCLRLSRLSYACHTHQHRKCAPAFLPCSVPSMCVASFAHCPGPSFDLRLH